MEMRDAIVQLRRTHPGWGPTTLLAELRVDRRWADHPLPSRSRIAALLKAAKLTRRYQKLSSLPTPAIQPEGAPHDEWKLDAEAKHACSGSGESESDHHYRCREPLAAVESYPCLDTTNPPLEAYQLMLRRALPPCRPATAHLVGSRNGLVREHVAIAISDPLAFVAPRLGNRGLLHPQALSHRSRQN